MWKSNYARAREHGMVEQRPRRRGRFFARARGRYQDQEFWFLSVPRDPRARMCRVPHDKVRVRRYWVTCASSYGVGVYMECNTVAGSVTWLFREVPGWPREARAERGCIEKEGERGCNDATGRGKDRGRKRPARRNARGGAPSFVSFRRASLSPLRFLLFFFLLPHRIHLV